MTENLTLLQYGREGRKHALANYHWEGNAPLMDDLYESVLESPSGKR